MIPCLQSGQENHYYSFAIFNIPFPPVALTFHILSFLRNSEMQSRAVFALFAVMSSLSVNAGPVGFLICFVLFLIFRGVWDEESGGGLQTNMSICGKHAKGSPRFSVMSTF